MCRIAFAHLQPVMGLSGRLAGHNVADGLVTAGSWRGESTDEGSDNANWPTAVVHQYTSAGLFCLVSAW